MRHQPHLWVSAPWESDRLEPGADTVRHIVKVLRYDDGDPVTYTDGVGTIGSGIWADGAVRRGDEQRTERTEPSVTIAVAAPAGRDRQRFIVEKLQELGVERLVWLRTTYGGHRTPSPDRASAWARSALEQSRGAWLMAIEGPVAVAAHPGGLVADSGGPPLGSLGPVEGSVTVSIGPEGGFTPDESAVLGRPISLGGAVLRTETAAIVAAGILRSV